MFANIYTASTGAPKYKANTNRHKERNWQKYNDGRGI